MEQDSSKGTILQHPKVEDVEKFFQLFKPASGYFVGVAPRMSNKMPEGTIKSNDQIAAEKASGFMMGMTVIQINQPKRDFETSLSDIKTGDIVIMNGFVNMPEFFQDYEWEEGELKEKRKYTYRAYVFRIDNIIGTLDESNKDEIVQTSLNPEK